jgi:hypothetical protein
VKVFSSFHSAEHYFDYPENTIKFLKDKIQPIIDSAYQRGREDAEKSLQERIGRAYAQGQEDSPFCTHEWRK